MRKKILLVMLVAALIGLMTGCGKPNGLNDGDSEREPETVEATLAEDAKEDNGENAVGANETTAEESCTHAGPYIKVGSNVYFRFFEQDELPLNAFNGTFRETAVLKNKKAKILCFDEEAKKEAQVICEVGGDSKMAYHDGILYTDDRDGDTCKVVAIDVKTAAVTEFCAGSIRAVDNKSGDIAVGNTTDDGYTLSVYSGDSKKGTILLSSEEQLTMCSLKEQKLAYGYAENEDNLEVHLFQPGKKKDNLLETFETYGSSDKYRPRCMQLEICDDNVYAVVAFISGGSVYWDENQRALTVWEVSDEGVKVDRSANINEDQIIAEDLLPEILVVDAFRNTAYCGDNAIRMNMVKQGIPEGVDQKIMDLPGLNYDTDCLYRIEYSQYIDGVLYAMINRVSYNLEETVSAGEVYDILEAHAVRIDVASEESIDMYAAPAERKDTYEEYPRGTSDDVSQTGPENVPYFKLTNPALEEYFAADDHVAYPVKFKTIVQEANGIIDDEDWFYNNDLNGLREAGDGYYDYRVVDNYDKYTGSGYELWADNRYTGETDFILDLSEFHEYPGLPEEYADSYWKVEFRFAYYDVETGYLFISMSHPTYADSMPYNAYIIAVNPFDGTVVWKSRPLSSNADNFAIADDIIYCGYGFTDEDDFIYQVNKYTGEIINTIPVKTGPDYFYVRDGHLFVRTYNTNYEFAFIYDN